MRIIAFITIGTITLFSFAGPVVAAVNDDVALCRTALADHPELAAAKYAAKFERYREGRVRTVRFALRSRGDDGSRRVVCAIEKGIVVRLEFRER